MAEVTKSYTVLTGGNRGIGFGICKQLAASGITVVLTARNEKKGLEAIDKIKDFGVSGEVLFHQLDVAEPASVDSLTTFIKTQFGKLDILVNNAGISGATLHLDALLASLDLYVSSIGGKLERIPSGWANEVLNNLENLTEEKLDEVRNQFLQDFKEGSLETKGWPTATSAYIVLKAALNGYTRILAKKYPSFYINAVCPGYVKTDINFNRGHLTLDEGAEEVVRLALLPNGGPSSLFFSKGEVTPF